MKQNTSFISHHLLLRINKNLTWHLGMPQACRVNLRHHLRREPRVFGAAHAGLPALPSGATSPRLQFCELRLQSYKLRL
jgi:hypothetical protein